MNLRVMADEAAATIQSRTGISPALAVVLGSGLGSFAGEISGAMEISYADIPNWPVSTAVGHAGVLVAGRVGDVPVAVLSGRAHLYEGYTPQQSTFGVRVMKALGAHSMVFTNAAGGINLSYSQGTLVLLSDHLNLQGLNPLAGPNDEKLGPRFPDMSEAYSKAYREIARAEALRQGFQLPEGVYAGLLGPNYETPAEIRYLRAIGADLVGMSTVGEVIAARHAGMKVLAISCVTNMAAGVLDRLIDHEEVLETGRQVRSRLTNLLKAVIPQLRG